MAMQKSTSQDDDRWADKCPAAIHRPPTPPPPFRFLDLPGEIQNYIVDDFIVSRRPITIRIPQFNRHPSPPPRPREHPRYDRPVPPTPPLSRSASVDSTKPSDAALGHTRLAIMLTCRKLYREHWRTYYGANMFDFSLETFGPFVEQIPQRCKAQIRRVRFRMPHKHHHGRIWAMLAGLKRLEELELQLCPPSQAEDSEYEHAREGAKNCMRLVRFSVQRRDSEEEAKSYDKAGQILEKDSDVADEINAWLEERKHRRASARNPSGAAKKPCAGESSGDESETGS